MFAILQNETVDSLAFIRMEGMPGPDEIQVYIDAQRKRIASRDSFRRVLVVSVTERWNPSERKAIKDFEQEHKHGPDKDPLGMAILVQNAFIRGAFQAFTWLAPPPYPTKMFADAENAYDWVADHIRGASIEVPSRGTYLSASQNLDEICICCPKRGFVRVTSEQYQSEVAQHAQDASA